MRNNGKSFGLLLVFGGFLLSLVYLSHTLAHKHHIVHGSDSYYYAALADGYQAHGRLLDMSVIPARPPHTLQNAVPVYHILMNRLGVSLPHALVILTLMYYLAWLSAVYPFDRLMVWAGVRKHALRGVLAAGFLGSGWILRYQLGPATDGFFNAGVFWLLFLLLYPEGTGSVDRVPHSKRQSMAAMVAALLISAILVHFSIRLIAVPLALLFAQGILHRSLRRPVGLPLACALTGLASMGIGYLAVDSYDLTSESTVHYFNDIIGNLSQLGAKVAKQYFVEHHGAAADLLAVGLLMLIAFALWQGYRKRNAAILALSALFVVSHVGFVLGLPEDILVPAGPRYVIFTLPLTWLLLARFRQTRLLAVLLVAIDVMRTCMMMYVGSTHQDKHGFYAYLYEQNLEPPGHVLFHSQHYRQTYGLMQARHHRDLCSRLPEHKAIWIAGDSAFRETTLARIRSCGIEVISSRIVSSDYKDASGYAVEEIVFCQP